MKVWNTKMNTDASESCWVGPRIQSGAGGDRRGTGTGLVLITNPITIIFLINLVYLLMKGPHVGDENINPCTYYYFPKPASCTRL